MIQKLMTKYVSTKVDKDDAAVMTNLTVDFGLLNEADMQEYVMGAAIIKWQALARKTSIPKTATYIVPKPGTRSAPSIEATLDAMSPEQLDALLAKAQAIKEAKENAE